MPRQKAKPEKGTEFDTAQRIEDIKREIKEKQALLEELTGSGIEAVDRERVRVIAGESDYYVGRMVCDLLKKLARLYQCNLKEISASFNEWDPHSAEKYLTVPTWKSLTKAQKEKAREFTDSILDMFEDTQREEEADATH